MKIYRKKRCDLPSYYLGDKMAETAQLRLSDLIEPKFVLRAVSEMTVDFLSLVDSIKDFGFLGAITVRPAPEGRRHLGLYEIVDGFNRVVASKRAGKTTINSTITPMTDEEVIRFQVVANAVRIKTHPVEYARHIKRIQELHPTWSLRKIADCIKRSPSWLSETLGLLRLVPSIQTLVDQGGISVANAWDLARLPPRVQERFVVPAGSLSHTEFTALLRDVKRKNRFKWQPERQELHPYLRSLSEIIKERKTKKNISQLLTFANAKTQLEAIDVALDWVVKMDPVTLEQRRQKREVKYNLRQTYRDEHEINPHT